MRSVVAAKLPIYENETVTKQERNKEALTYRTDLSQMESF